MEYRGKVEINQYGERQLTFDIEQCMIFKCFTNISFCKKKHNLLHKSRFSIIDVNKSHEIFIVIAVPWCLWSSWIPLATNLHSHRPLSHMHLMLYIFTIMKNIPSWPNNTQDIIHCRHLGFILNCRISWNAWNSSVKLFYDPLRLPISPSTSMLTTESSTKKMHYTCH